MLLMHTETRYSSYSTAPVQWALYPHVAPVILELSSIGDSFIQNYIFTLRPQNEGNAIAYYGNKLINNTEQTQFRF